MKVFKTPNYLQVNLSDGSSFSTTENIDSLWEFLQENANDQEAIKERLFGSRYSGKELMEKVKRSNILTLRGASVYMLEVSQLSIPEDFVAKIIHAEEEGNLKELQKFKNFWTLVSLNPDARVRNNLFWFIRKWNMQITDSGLIIAYRNADIKTEAKYSTEVAKRVINTYYQEKYLNNNDPFDIAIEIDGVTKNLGVVYDDIVNGASSPVYTDMHSHSTTIRLGSPVSIPRAQCDSEQENSCSRGLHCGAKGWLKQNYFGNVGLMVLVNPANVVAVPTIDEYGKMRTCEYFPVAIIDFDSEGDVIETPYTLHNDVAYLKALKYDGQINNTDIDYYVIDEFAGEINRENIYNSILQSLNANR